jgi:hypothetical protein
VIIFKLITGLVALVTLGLTGYLYQLLEQGNYLEQAAEMSGESVLTFHIASAVVIAWLIFCLIKKVISTTLVVIFLVLALGVEGSFLSMNLSGDINVITDNFSQKALSSAKELLDKVKTK